MKCESCGYIGRGKGGYYPSTKEGEHWRCPECGELTKKPNINYCKIKIDKLEKEIVLLKAAMQNFVNKVDTGKARSVDTYNKFKELL